MAYQLIEKRNLLMSFLRHRLLNKIAITEKQ